MSRHRGPTLLLTTLLAVALLQPVASAATGLPSSGSSPVVANDRTALELAAEGHAIEAHNDQRAAGNTRDGVTHGDVDGGPPLVPYTDMMTVSRRWADRIDLNRFSHNPDYGDQYGHWRRAGENIAAATIDLASRGTPSRAQVVAATERLLDGWWDSDGHRRNWMQDHWDHISVGASVKVTTVNTSMGPREYWTLSLVTNFREHDGSRIDGRSFPADGSAPPNETTASSGPFLDVPADHLFVAPITALAESGVTTGCGGNRFCPDDGVTRGQMAAFLTRALDLPPGSITFADTRGHLFETPVAALARARVTAGCGGDRFCPEDVVTRGQMAAFLTRALDLRAGTATFSDTRGHLFQEPIAALARAGVTAGCGGDKFCPDAAVTRAQMAAFLQRAGVLD